MDNKLEVFTNEQFGQVRVVMIDNEPWFVGKDIATALGYSKPENAVAAHVNDEDRTTTLIQGTGSNYKSKTVIINESGMYSLIFGSKLESAKEFKHWVTAKVLPSIRKTGTYMTPEAFKKAMDDPDSFFSMMDNIMNKWRDERDERIKAEKKANQLGTENDMLSQEVLSWADRPLIHSMVRAYGKAISGKAIPVAMDYKIAWDTFKKELLYKHGINLNSRTTHYFNTHGTKPRVLNMLDDSEVPAAVSTITAMCRSKNVNLAHLIHKQAG